MRAVGASGRYRTKTDGRPMAQCNRCSAEESWQTAHKLTEANKDTRSRSAAYVGEGRVDRGAGGFLICGAGAAAATALCSLTGIPNGRRLLNGPVELAHDCAAPIPGQRNIREIDLIILHSLQRANLFSLISCKLLHRLFFQASPRTMRSLRTSTGSLFHTRL